MGMTEELGSFIGQKDRIIKARVDTLDTTTADHGGRITVLEGEEQAGDKDFLGNVTVRGMLTVLGGQVVLEVQEVQVSDNEIVLNKDEPGDGVTAGFSGIRVYRGPNLAPYLFQFVEEDETFKIGQEGSLQAAATREDTPLDGGVMVWDATNSRLKSVDRAPSERIRAMRSVNKQFTTSPLGSGIYLTASAYAEEDLGSYVKPYYVLCGSAGKLGISNSATSFSLKTTGLPTQEVKGAAFLGSALLAVAPGGAKISPDYGTTWGAVPAAPATYYRGVCADTANNRFIVTLSGGLVGFFDGAVWTGNIAVAPDTWDMQQVEVEGDVIIALSTNGSGTAASAWISTDGGTTWAEKPGAFSCLAKANGIFYVSGTTEAYITTDGVNFTPVSTSIGTSVVGTNFGFVSKSSHQIGTSVDGERWEFTSLVASSTNKILSFGNFVVLSNGSSECYLSNPA